ncbi:MAG: hypothetical protein NTX03_01765 [Bacteroidetes bacterium]|nr:hypothetical protein [Bacteroidota bacterium]
MSLNSIEVRLQLLSEKRNKGEMLITDLYDENQNATGTQVQIKIPIL